MHPPPAQLKLALCYLQTGDEAEFGSPHRRNDEHLLPRALVALDGVDNDAFVLATAQQAANHRSLRHRFASNNL